jgi:hypothetical protein
MNPDPNNPMDTATQARLRQLRSMPLALGALREGLAQQIARQEEPAAVRVWHRALWQRPLVRIAAAILLLAGPLTIAALIVMPRDAVASPEQFASLHQRMQSPAARLTPVADMDSAERAIRAKWSGAPDMPRGMACGRMMTCCIHDLAGKQAAVVMLRSGEHPVTMAVVDASQVSIPRRGLVTYNGRDYYAGKARGVRMIMFERAGKSVCIMGDAPQEELLQLADAAKF